MKIHIRDWRSGGAKTICGELTSATANTIVSDNATCDECIAEFRKRVAGVCDSWDAIRKEIRDSWDAVQEGISVKKAGRLKRLAGLSEQNNASWRISYDGRLYDAALTLASGRKQENFLTLKEAIDFILEGDWDNK